MNSIRELFLILSGISLSIGLLSLLTALYMRTGKVYLYYGIFSISAGLYYMFFSWHSPVLNPDLVNDFLLMTFAASFHIVLPWFIREFTNSGSKSAAIVLSLAIFIGYLMYLFSGLNMQYIPWRIIVHTGSLGIVIYGIINGWVLFPSSKTSGILFIASMAAFFLLLVDEILKVYFGVTLIPKGEAIPLPLDFYPLGFIVLMAYVLAKDLARGYILQKKIFEKDRRWSVLMDSVRFIVTELNLNGEIKYVNSYFKTLSGYTSEETFGRNWFDLMIPEGEKKNLFEIHRQELETDTWPEFKNKIITKSGESLIMNWSNLPIRDDDGYISGVLSIGFDQTKNEEQFNEIKELKKQLEMENLMLQEEVARRSGGLEIIGDSSPIKYAINKAMQVAPLDSTVLLEGETGVGKELFANLVQSRSRLLNRHYLKINCAAIPRELIESELFGHKKGSFTGAVSDKKGHFEMADGGTLFLDEISAMPIELQSKLLRVLQSGEFHPVGSEKSIKVNVRIIAATNENLKTLSDKGEFRKDLYYRLNVFPITIPPLRQRSEDIPLLISHFSQLIGKRMDKIVGKVSQADMEKLMAYDWPGNVRELENWVERAIISSQDENLKFAFEQDEESESRNGNQSMKEIQKQAILEVLEECEWKINGSEGAAQKLKLHPSTLRSKMKKLGITRSV